jgi:membrane protease YdiL (CAAX protease family)
LALGPDGFSGTADTIVLSGTLSLFGPSIAGTLLTGLIDGRAGLRALGSRLGRWRVGARWYAVALLAAPLLNSALLLVALASSDYLPGIITADEKLVLVLTGIGIGIFPSVFEEIGWTGFAKPRLRLRFSILAAGLLMGLLWGLWHLPLFAGSAEDSGDVPPAIYVAVQLFAWLPPYRVLMVWLYDRTQSLLLVMLMHFPIVVNQYVFGPEDLSGRQMVIALLAWGAVLWSAVAVVLVSGRRSARRTPIFTS